MAVLPVSTNMVFRMLSRRRSAHYKFFRLCFHDMFCRTNAWNIFNVVCKWYHAKTMVLECFGWIALTYSCTKLIDYPESSVPLVFCIPESCLKCFSIMPLGQGPSFQLLQTWYLECFRGGVRHTTSFSDYVFRRFFAGPMINPWNILKDLQCRVQMVFCMQLQNNGAWILWMDCAYLQLHKAHWLSWK